jgi:hypothetical protein
MLIDFEKAYVSVRRDLLYNILTEFDITTKLLTYLLTHSTHSLTHSMVHDII